LQGDRNLAAVLFDEKRYEEASAAYAKLVEANPRDPSLRASYAGALGALHRYDDALAQLTEAIRLNPISAEAYHNRAVIHERRGDRDSAIRDYLAALRYRSDFAPSREALQRLHVNPDPSAPSGDSEQRAKALADEAANVARRGDYPKAMQLLDEAKKVAPRYVLIYQYESNVAYLMGDRAKAIAALRKGLEIEPDNALFRENLRRLERP
jgi:tetratricopeptide (TPR) repeat protein